MNMEGEGCIGAALGCEFLVYSFRTQIRPDQKALFHHAGRAAECCGDDPVAESHSSYGHCRSSLIGSQERPEARVKKIRDRPGN